MRRPGFSITIRRLLLGIWPGWAAPLIMDYREPRRAGTPHGEKIGLSRSKYYCALLQALHGPFSLPELSKASVLAKFSTIKGVELTGASTALMKLWRTEERFRDEADKASRSFAEVLLQEVQRYTDKDDFKALYLLEALAILPGFNMVDNKLVKVISNNPEYLSCYNEIIEFCRKGPL